VIGDFFGAVVGRIAHKDAVFGRRPDVYVIEPNPIYADDPASLHPLDQRAVYREVIRHHCICPPATVAQLVVAREAAVNDLGTHRAEDSLFRLQAGKGAASNDHPRTFIRHSTTSNPTDQWPRSMRGRQPDLAPEQRPQRHVALSDRTADHAATDYRNLNAAF